MFYVLCYNQKLDGSYLEVAGSTMRSIYVLFTKRLPIEKDL